MNSLNEFIEKNYEPIGKWKPRLGTVRWVVLLLVALHFHLLHKNPIFLVDLVNLTELSFLFYVIGIELYLSKSKITAKFQLLKLFFDLIFTTLFVYLTLRLYGAESWIYVLYLLPIVLCCQWFSSRFSFIYVNLISVVYFTISYLLLESQNFYSVIEKFGPVFFIFYFVAGGVLYFKKELKLNYAQIENIAKIRGVDLEHEKEFKSTFLKSSIDGIVAIDGRGKITMVNNRAREILGYEEVALGNLITKYYAKGEALKVMSHLLESKDGTIENLKTYFVNEYGEKFPVLLSGAFLYDRKLNLREEIVKGRRFPSLGFFRDISVEEELNKLSTTTEYLNNEKALLDRIVKIISKAVRAETCAVLLYNESSGELCL